MRQLRQFVLGERGSEFEDIVCNSLGRGSSIRAVVLHSRSELPKI